MGSFPPVAKNKKQLKSLLCVHPISFLSASITVLIHSQIAVTWSHYIGCNLLLVANDGIYDDSVRQSLMDMAVPPGMATRYLSIQQTIERVHKAEPEQQIVLIIESPEDAVHLARGGVPFTEVNVGNMHFSEGKQQIHKTVSVDKDDIAAFKDLAEMGIECSIQTVPQEPHVYMQDLL